MTCAKCHSPYHFTEQHDAAEEAFLNELRRRGITPELRTAMPHCDSRVLHAPGECRYCDSYPDWQSARAAWGINFTSKHEEGKLPCPSEQARPLETIERWPGNRAAPPAGSASHAPAHVTPLSAGLVDDRSKLDQTILPSGQQKTYLVLSEAERAKGYVRPVRKSYRHVGIAGPKYPTRDLTDEERAKYVHPNDPPGESYVKCEEPPGGEPFVRRFWTQHDLDRVGKGCGTTTTMGSAIAETYARNPGFYGGTFCVGCGTHLPVGEDGEFVWEDGTRVGT